METAKNAVEDNLPDYFSQLKDCTKDSFLEELDDVQLRTSEHRSMYSYVRLSIDRCTATYV